jgi:hypothetical protein
MLECSEYVTEAELIRHALNIGLETMQKEERRDKNEVLRLCKDKRILSEGNETRMDIKKTKNVGERKK